MGRTKPNTSWTPRAGIQIDLSYLTNNSGNRVTNNFGNRILIHSGIFYSGKTDWTPRIKPATTWN